MATIFKPKFQHYGIRKEDLDLYRSPLCEKHQFDFYSLSEDIPAKYHTEKVDKIEMPRATPRRLSATLFNNSVRQ